MSQQSLSDLFRASSKLNYEVEGQINEVYCGKDVSSGSNTDIRQTVIPQIRSKIAQLNEQIEEIEGIFASLKTSNNYTVQSLKKDDDNLVYWKNKIERLRQSTSQLPANLEKALKSYTRMHSMNTEIGDGKRGGGGVERRRFNQLQKEHDSLDKSMGYANEIDKHGETIINSLYGQSETLKKVKSRTLQMLGTIGMSESILRLIERRTKTDMMIFVILAIVTLLLIYFLMCVVKPMLGAGPATAAAVTESDT